MVIRKDLASCKILTMKLRLKNSNFSKNIGFYAKISRKCLVCDSAKIFTNELGVSCNNCGSSLDFEENSCIRI